MSNFQFRGCCCGIPLGCGALLIALLAALIWKLVMPLDLWSSGVGRGLALFGVPGVVLVLIAAAGAKRSG